MKRFFLFCLFALLCGCDRYPSSLSQIEQAQALVFAACATRVYGHSSSDSTYFPLFLCCDDPQTDPSPAVMNYVARRFRSVHPWSARPINPDFKSGLWIKSFWRETFGFIPNELAVTVIVYYDGKENEEICCHLRYDEGRARWKVILTERIWIS